MAQPGTLLAFLTLNSVFSSSAYTDCSYYGLLDHLNLTSSNTALQIMRPVKNWTDPTFVSVDMILLGILEVDELSQTVTNHIFIRMFWTNEFLTWNSSDFCGIENMTLPHSTLWVPDIGIDEDVSDTGSVLKSPFLSVHSDGSVYTSRRQRLTYTCRLNLFYFPFDTQNCSVKFSSMTSSVNSIKLGTISSDENLTEISEAALVTRGEWTLKSITITKFMDQTDKALSKLEFMVEIQRKPLLYFINFIIPLFYFLVLDVTSFFISEARGEKLSFKVTLILSISVLLLILQDMLPSTEDSLPLIAMYCVGIFSLVGLSVLEAMMVIFIIDLDNCCVKKAESNLPAEVDIPLDADFLKEPVGPEEKGEVKQEWNCLLLKLKLLQQILGELKAVREEVRRPDKNNEKRGCFRRLAEILDRAFFVFYLLTVVFFLVLMYLFWVSKAF
ncbi:5-hydroxytryptamine receptor 3A-like isoform 2-T2 [Pholidichthys leucotaenia]